MDEILSFFIWALILVYEPNSSLYRHRKMRKTNRTISSLDSKINDKTSPFNRMGSFAIKSAPIIIVIKRGVAYFKYILAIISVPQTISIIATRKRVVWGSGSPKL